MSDILVTSPYRPFTLPNQFKAVFNGFIYCGTVDAVDPSNSQVQVYVVSEGGSRTPVAQPLRTNAGGFLAYNGQPAKFVTDSNHSLLVRDSLGNQLWYAPDMAVADPDTAFQILGSQVREAQRRSYAEAGYTLVDGSFQAGFTLVNASDVALDETTGKAFSGAAGTYPAGTSTAAFVDESNVMSMYHTLLAIGIYPEKYGAVGDDDDLGGGTDDTAAFQRALNAGPVIRLSPGKKYKITGNLIASQGLTTFVGPGFLYGNSQINYYGSGALITALNAVAYLQIIGGVFFNGVPGVPTDAYRTGSVLFDVTAGSTSITAIGVRLEGFEIIAKGNYNSFYNTIENCRINKFKTGFDKFSTNNFNIRSTRFGKFNKLSIVNGGGGPITIQCCAIEEFNGEICEFTGAEEGVVNFLNNYVETYDNLSLPTNFPASNPPRVDKWGQNILFSGPIKTFINKGNELQIGGVFRYLSTGSNMEHLESTGNLIHLHPSNNNLDKMWAVPSVKTLIIADARGSDYGDGSGYSVTYGQGAISTPVADGNYNFWDCIVSKMLRPNLYVTLSMQNGWVSTDPDFGILKCKLENGNTELSGVVDGTSSTGNVISTIPASRRPYTYGTDRKFANFTANSDHGAGAVVRLRYIYDTGELRCEGSPSLSSNVPLDGIIIPART